MNAAAGTSAKGNDILEERLIDNEYKIWKKNTPYLYDLVLTHALEWPSLTCQWLPKLTKLEDQQVDEHSLLLGTHTVPGEQNYLMIASVKLPNEESKEVTDPKEAKYDDERGEVGGFGVGVDGKIEIKMKMKHDGEVNKARYCPKNPFLISTKGPSSEVYVFDVTKHESFPSQNSAPAPQHILRGHSSEGYGLAWEPEGYRVASGSDDGKVCLWDVAGAKEISVDALKIFGGHKDVVEDVCWHPKDSNVVASVSDDRSIMLWDVREKNSNVPAHVVLNAHDGDINGISFNPVNEYLFATASADKVVGLWDVRNMKSKIQALKGHEGQVFSVYWAPFNETILASCSEDRRINVWDLSRIGAEQSPEDAEDGPPELLFVHGGHTSKVSDFSWNLNDPWTVASCSEDNVVQVWHMAEEIYAEDDDDDEDDADLKDDELE